MGDEQRRAVAAELVGGDLDAVGAGNRPRRRGAPVEAGRRGAVHRSRLPDHPLVATTRVVLHRASARPQPAPALRQQRQGAAADVLGELVLPHGGTVWTSTLVDGLGLLGVDERNARQAAGPARASRACSTPSATAAAPAGTSPTAGRHLLTVGHRADLPLRRRTAGVGRALARRAVRRARGPAGQAPPAAQPARRSPGSGSSAPGTAVSPHPEREDVANAVLRDLDLVDSSIVLRRRDRLARRRTPRSSAGPGTSTRSPRATRRSSTSSRRRRPATPAERFAALVELVHAWRRFPFGDPEIPAELLPAGWPGRRAKQLLRRPPRRVVPGRQRAGSSEAEATCRC